jgi:hypothetical protein
MAQRSELGFGGAKRSEPGGVPWAGGSVSWRAVPRGLLVVARRAASRTAGASGAKRRAAPSQLSKSEATRAIAWRMAAASGANRQAASLLVKAAPTIASRMAAAGGASTRAAPRQLLEAARVTARRMEAAGVAKWRAASSQSFELPAAYTADSV